MKRIIMDFVNAGLAAFREAEITIKDSLNNLESKFDELKKKGESQNDEQSQKIRSMLDEFLSELEDAGKKTGEHFESASKKAEQIMDNLDTRLKDNLSDETYTELKGKIDELRKSVTDKFKSRNKDGN